MSDQTVIEQPLPTEAAMRVNPLSTAKLMRAVIKLYGNQWEAVLREYSSNALDSHRRAGVDRPVEITLPTWEASSLIIEDFGVGLSWRDIHDIYVEVGTSTKEGDHTQIGHYGFGAKSGIMVAERFTLRTRKDGIEYHIECVRNGEGIGVFRLLGQNKTLEHNGVRVEIPSASGEEPFSEKDVLEKFFTGWPVGSILINRQEPMYQLANPNQFHVLKFGNTTVGWVAKDRITNQLGPDAIFASLGGVIYKINSPGWNDAYRDAYNKLNRYKRRVYVNIPIESVEVTPSRESLSYDATTKQTLAKMLNEIVQLIELQAQQQVEAAPTAAAAFEVYLRERTRGLWTLKNLTYRGQTLPESVDLPAEAWTVEKEEYRHSENKHNKFSSQSGKVLGMLHVRENKLAFVRVADRSTAEKFSKQYNLFLLGMPEGAPSREPVVYFHVGELDPWLKISAVTQLDEAAWRAQVKAGRLIKAAQRKEQNDTTFTLLSDHNWYEWHATQVTVADLRRKITDSEKPLVAIRKGSGKFAQMLAKLSTVSKGKFSLGYNTENLYRSIADSHTIVMLHTKTLIDKFEALFPEVPEFDELLRAKADAEYTRVLQEYGQRSVLQQFIAYRDGRYATTRIHATMINFALLGKREGYLDQIKQPELRAFFTELSDYNAQQIKRKESLLNWFNLRPENDVTATTRAKELAAIAAQYPLFAIDSNARLEGKTVEHLLTYLNTVSLKLAEKQPEAAE